jgi:hypothetical protein
MEHSQRFWSKYSLVGVNNIVIEPIIEQTEENLAESSATGKEKKKFSPGLSLKDVEAISMRLYQLYERIEPGNCTGNLSY